MNDIWNINFDWTFTGNTWYRKERLDTYWSGVTYIPDNYFKYQKCVSGICYQYVNSLDDIYQKNIMIGTNYCIYNMYNEFDIINNYMNNLDFVDVCSTSNIDLTQRHYKIDGVYLKSKHKILLKDQNNKSENDIYVVNSKGFLTLSSRLNDENNSYRYKAYVKMGDENKTKEYYLKNIGSLFPMTGQTKDFIVGKDYIIKNYLNYNIYQTGNTSDIVPKLIFTDYEIPRQSLYYNYEFYSGFTLPTLTNANKIGIRYNEESYDILLNDNENMYVYTGLTGNYITNIYNSGDTSNTSMYGTYVKVGADFCSMAYSGDYVKIQISGDTSAILYTFIRKINDPLVPTDYIVLKDIIPDNILNTYYTGTTTAVYTVRDLKQCKSDFTSISDCINSSPYSKYVFCDTSLNVLTVDNDYNYYFDYDGIMFGTTGITNGSYWFTTNNFYIKYKLYEQLNVINPSVFTNSYTFSNGFNITSFTTEYINPTDIKGTYIKIIPTNSNDMYFVKNNTYVNINDTYKTLVVDYSGNTYFIIETYKSDTGITISSINSLYSLTGISSILYDVYKNIDYNSDYYKIRDDSIRKKICNSYASLICDDPNIIKLTTGLLSQDEKQKFTLRLYNPENYLNNGGHITLSYDPNLIFKPIELLEIGNDKHTKIPIPILNENLSILYDITTGTTSGSTGSTTDDKFYIYLNSSLGNFNYTFKSFDVVGISIDYGDGIKENISFNGFYSGGHVYSTTGLYVIIFSGDLRNIELFIAGDGIYDVKNIKNMINLSKLSFENNYLKEIDITGLIYLTALKLENNHLTSSVVDSLFMILDSNGLNNGAIDTTGINNGLVTSLSQTARTNLTNKLWSLYYNI